MDCARNIITANFSSGVTSATTAPLWQWDYGQVLCITGIDLPAAFEVHFSTNRSGGVSTVAVGADGQVTIPNMLLTIGKNLNAWIYLSDAQGEGETEYSITIPVKARPMPETYDAEVTGEFDDVVRQVSEYAETAQTAADNAGASASAAATSASEAAASASAAETAKNAAETAQGKAEDAQAAAETAAQTATEKAQQTAQDAAQAARSKADAESAAQRAEAAQAGAESAKTDAETAAQGAAASASAASASATSAGQAAISAGQSATAAAGSATTAENAAQTATTKAGEASASATAANTAKTAAQTAQTGAETAATNAGQSASTATAKAAEAAQSATDAAASKTAAEAAATRAETAAASLTVDSALSDSSVNPVQNKVVTGEFAQVKSAIDALKITDTASGAIASFPDGAAMPVESLTVEMEPIQDLHGQDAPYPGGGGVNKWDGLWESGGLRSTDGTDTVDANRVRSTSYIPISAETAYYMYCTIDTINTVGVYYYASDKSFLETKSVLRNASFTSVANAAYMRFAIGGSSTPVTSITEGTMAINYPATVTTYSPYSNIRPITGRDSVTVWRTGGNVFGGDVFANACHDVWGADISEGTDGKYWTKPNGGGLSDLLYFSDYFKVKENTAYTFIFDGVAANNVGFFRIFYTDGTSALPLFPTTRGQVVFTSPANKTISGMDIINQSGDRTVYFATSGIFEGALTAADFVPYDGTSVTIQFGQTVYGGNAEIISGSGESSYALATFTGGFIQHPTLSTLFYRNNSFADASTGVAYCNQYKYAAKAAASLAEGEFTIDTKYTRIVLKSSTYATSAYLNAYLAEHPLTVAYPLAAPTALTLEPQTLSTLKGDNTVWSDADSVEVEYVADPKLYIARLTEPDSDMIADANITSGQYFMVGNNLYLATTNIASGAAITPGVNCTRTNLAAALNAINA